MTIRKEMLRLLFYINNRVGLLHVCDTYNNNDVIVNVTTLWCPFYFLFKYGLAKNRNCTEIARMIAIHG